MRDHPTYNEKRQCVKQTRVSREQDLKDEISRRPRGQPSENPYVPKPGPETGSERSSSPPLEDRGKYTS